MVLGCVRALCCRNTDILTLCLIQSAFAMLVLFLAMSSITKSFKTLHKGVSHYQTTHRKILNRVELKDDIECHEVVGKIVVWTCDGKNEYVMEREKLLSYWIMGVALKIIFDKLFKEKQL